MVAPLVLEIVLGSEVRRLVASGKVRFLALGAGTTHVARVK